VPGEWSASKGESREMSTHRPTVTRLLLVQSCLLVSGWTGLVSSMLVVVEYLVIIVQVREILQEEEDLSEIVQLVGKVLGPVLCFFC